MNQPNQKPMNPFGSMNMINIQANDGRPTQLLNQQGQANNSQQFAQMQGQNPQDQQYANFLMQLLQGGRPY